MLCKKYYIEHLQMSLSSLPVMSQINIVSLGTKLALGRCDMQKGGFP